MPVSIAPVDRKPRPVVLKFRFKARDQSTILIVDGTLAAKMMIVVGHFEHALARYIPAAQNIFEKRHHIVRPLRSAERKDQYRVVVVLAGHSPTILGRRHRTTARGSPEQADRTPPDRWSGRRRPKRPR